VVRLQPAKPIFMLRGPIVTTKTEPAGTAIDRFLRARPTPLLQISERVIAKLESLRPAGCVDDRALAIWDPFGEKRNPLVACLPGHAVLAGAGWARARGVSLHALVFGPVTHEVSETLLLWGTKVTRYESRFAAEVAARVLDHHGEMVLPALDGDEAITAVRETLGTELSAQLGAAKRFPSMLVAPAGAVAALVGSMRALGTLNAAALYAASPADVLPELPARAEAEKLFAKISSRVDLVPITRDLAQLARAQLAKSHGLSASHAAAVCVAHAQLIAANAPNAVVLAFITATGEREFSLDPAVPTPRSSFA
jgi:cysteine synthase